MVGLARFTKPRILKDGDPIAGFHSGAESVDMWLSSHGATARKQGGAVVYVSFDRQSGRLAGYYTLSSGSIMREVVDGGWLQCNEPQHIPVILLGQLGVDQHFAHQGLGGDLLTDALRRSCNVAQSIGVRALLIDSLPQAVDFYARHGFTHVPGHDSFMFTKVAQRQHSGACQSDLRRDSIT